MSAYLSEVVLRLGPHLVVVGVEAFDCVAQLVDQLFTHFLKLKK